MNLLVNGKAETADDGTTVAALMAKLGYAKKAVAIAVNGDFVPRSRHASHELKENDEIEFVAPMQGG